MKIKLAILASVAAIFLSSCGGSKPAREKLLIAGSWWDSIAIIDKQTKEIEWTYALPAGSECNSVKLTPEGNILFSYKKGARLIDRKGNTIWDYTYVQDPAELQTAELIDGGYLLAVCDNPMRLIELDEKGLPTSEIRYDLDIETPHAQFRQVIKSRAGTYLVPIITQGVVLEIDKNANLVHTYEVGGNPFCVEELDNGNLLVGCGDGHSFVEISRAGDIVKTTDQSAVKGIELQFVAQVKRLSNGNTYVCNWLGHVDARYPQPMLVDLDPAGNVVWSFDDKDNVTYISAIYPFTE